MISQDRQAAAMCPDTAVNLDSLLQEVLCLFQQRLLPLGQRCLAVALRAGTQPIDGPKQIDRRRAGPRHGRTHGFKPGTKVRTLPSSLLVGRVADRWSLSELHRAMKGDIGIGIRAYVNRIGVRIDMAGSEEGFGVQMLVGQAF